MSCLNSLEFMLRLNEAIKYHACVSPYMLLLLCGFIAGKHFMSNLDLFCCIETLNFIIMLVRSPAWLYCDFWLVCIFSLHPNRFVDSFF